MPSTVRNLLERHLIWVLLSVLVAFGLTVPGFSSVQNLTNVLWAAAPLGCMVLGLFLVLLIKEVDLSLESTFAFAPTVAIMLMTVWAPGLVHPVLAVILTPFIGLAVGLASGAFAVTLRVNAFLVTLATLLVMRGAVIFLIPEGVYYLPSEYTYLGEQRWFGIPVAIFVWLLLYGVAYIFMERHRIGKEVYAIGNNEEAAFLAGVMVHRTKIFCFGIAGLAAAVGGLLEVGRLQSVVADLGEGDILMVFAGTILGGTSLNGGIGRLSGVFGAVIVIAIIENLMNLTGIEPSIRQMVFGSVLLIAIYLASLQDRFASKASRS
ncbi:ABC transporter permease [Mesorhizobium sp. VNQ89]|uniref:ABC transporter permease n=1 Tax=Mesorhizobium quangtriensis TaxID=3157709 RepID=UPI0032B7CED5